MGNIPHTSYIWFKEQYQYKKDWKIHVPLKYNLIGNKVDFGSENIKQDIKPPLILSNISVFMHYDMF